MSLILEDRPFGTAQHVEFLPKPTSFDEAYLNFVAKIYNFGVDKEDRTGKGTRSLFGQTMRFNLQYGLPLLTTKFVPQKTVFDELKWFLEGSTNNNRLREINQMHSKLDWSEKDTIWQEWAKPNGELGPVYGKQWRNFRGDILQRYQSEDWNPLKMINVNGFEQALPDHDSFVRFDGIDQIQNVCDLLASSPDSRRILVDSWNPSEIHKMALPPCHVLFQFYTRPATWHERRIELERRYGHVGHDNTIDNAYFDSLGISKRVLCCTLYQRSADTMLGVPFNIVSYSMLLKMMAHQQNMIAGDFVWFGGDCHIYSDHFDGMHEQLSRTPSLKFPQMDFVNKPDSIFGYDWKDLVIFDYEPQAHIEFPVAV